MNATDGSCRLYFPDFGEEKLLWKSKWLCAAKMEWCSTQHILLFAKMQILFARKGQFSYTGNSG